jgi:hypothetical protein
MIAQSLQNFTQNLVDYSFWIEDSLLRYSYIYPWQDRGQKGIIHLDSPPLALHPTLQLFVCQDGQLFTLRECVEYLPSLEQLSYYGVTPSELLTAETRWWTV